VARIFLAQLGGPFAPVENLRLPPFPLILSSGSPRDLRPRSRFLPRVGTKLGTVRWLDQSWPTTSDVEEETRIPPDESNETQYVEIVDPLEAIQKTDPALAKILKTRDSLRPALKYLEEKITGESLRKEIREEQGPRLWQTVGNFYRFQRRWHEAIATFHRLYERICEIQKSHEEWLPKGMPLVWISDCHERLGHSLLGARYLLLAAISDAVRDEGKVNPDGGIYFRAQWERGWPDQDIEHFYQDCSSTYQQGSHLRGFPEYILSKVEIPFFLPYPTIGELDIYQLNRIFADEILRVLERKSQDGQRIDGKDLELLAQYLLGCVPGFEVIANVASKGPEYDGIIRNRGPKHDFRADIGHYLLLECKDWGKPVGVSVVSQLIHKLVMQDCRGGILFSSSGLTGAGQSRDAELEVIKAHYRAGRIVMVLDRNDFTAAAQGQNLTTMLRNKYEEIRFDIPRREWEK
jgi:hypothetical protein